MTWRGTVFVGPKAEASRLAAVMDAGGLLAVRRFLDASTTEPFLRLDGRSDVVDIFREILGTVSADLSDSERNPLGAFIRSAEKIVVADDVSVFWVSPETSDLIAARLGRVISTLMAREDEIEAHGLSGVLPEDPSWAFIQEVAALYDHGGASGKGVVVCLLQESTRRATAADTAHAYAATRPHAGRPSTGKSRDSGIRTRRRKR